MQNLIAVRVSCYGEFEHRAWTHLPEIGVRNIEMAVPPPDGVAALKQKLADHGLKASSLDGSCRIGLENVAETMHPQFEACQALGAKVMFASIQAGELDLDTAYSRLREVGDVAAQYGVTMGMETHPDLISNGDVALQTERAVDHPNVRVNFDTANVYYHNDIPGINAVSELAKIIDYVGSVHMKDTDGGYQSPCFPSLGQGVVDYPEVFRMLNARGFTGPFTMELEGFAGHTFDEPGQLKYVADSITYLKDIGVMG